MKKEITLNLDDISLPGILSETPNPIGLVIFVHGSGSSRLSKRNNFVADKLNEKNISTLLFDLLTEDEDLVYETRFNIGLLTDRLKKVTDWIFNNYPNYFGNTGYFGASTGAASAIQAAVEIKEIKTVVSRGGRPDLAGMDYIPRLTQPILLIVGGNDEQVIELNELAYNQANSVKMLRIVPGATHLFEEPGTLEEVADIAADWFKQYLSS